MDGGNIFAFTLETVPGIINDVMRKNNIDSEHVDLYVLHQANKFMLESLRRKMKIPEQKFFLSLERSANTVSATIPIALKEAVDHGRIIKGSRVIIAGFGVGLSWGGCVLSF